MKPINEGYLGNPLIKRAGIEHQYDEKELKEYLKCTENPTYFIENYTQIIALDEGLVPFHLRGYQEELINHYNENRFSVVSRSYSCRISKQRCNCKRDGRTYCNYVRVCTIFLTTRC